MRLEESFPGSTEVGVYRRKTSVNPHFVIVGVPANELDVRKVWEYLEGVDWCDRGSRGWITPHVRCDGFVKEKL